MRILNYVKRKRGGVSYKKGRLTAFPFVGGGDKRKFARKAQSVATLRKQRLATVLARAGLLARSTENAVAFTIILGS